MVLYSIDSMWFLKISVKNIENMLLWNSIYDVKWGKAENCITQWVQSNNEYTSKWTNPRRKMKEVWFFIMMQLHDLESMCNFELIGIIEIMFFGK